MALAASPVRAAVCDIEVDPSFPLYMVTVDGQAFKNKRYVDPSDALGLRDVLVESGMCIRSTRLRPCSVRKAKGGKYVVYRGKVNFDPMAVFAKPERANRHAKKMAKAHLCNFD
jgi:hypothetical protein